MTRKFKVGDKVKDYRFGDEVFTLESCNDNEYCLSYERNDVLEVFNREGKMCISHANPMLTLVEPVKEKKKVTVYRHYYQCRYSRNEISWIESTEKWQCDDEADKLIRSDIVTTLEVDND